MQSLLLFANDRPDLLSYDIQNILIMVCIVKSNMQNSTFANLKLKLEKVLNEIKNYTTSEIQKIEKIILDEIKNNSNLIHFSETYYNGIDHALISNKNKFYRYFLHIKQIGAGEYGRINVFANKCNNYYYAIKLTPKRNNDRNLLKAHHPFILKCFM
jgi:hypothetical protein